MARLVGFSTLALAEGTRWGSIPQAREREGGKTRYGICDAVSTALWEGARRRTVEARGRSKREVPPSSPKAGARKPRSSGPLHGKIPSGIRSVRIGPEPSARRRGKEVRMGNGFT